MADREGVPAGRSWEAVRNAEWILGCTEPPMLMLVDGLPELRWLDPDNKPRTVLVSVEAFEDMCAQIRELHEIRKMAAAGIPNA